MNDTFKNFPLPLGETISSFFHRELPDDTFDQNYRLFMKILGCSFDLPLSSTKEIEPDYRAMIGLSILELGQACHQTCSKFASWYPEVEQYFGFANEHNQKTGEYVGTFCHSFLVSKETGNLYDPQFEYLYVERFPNLAKNYYGVRLPTALVVSLEDIMKEQVVNISGYIKNNVFDSREKTLKFIDSIKSYDS
ncbi:MAG: hypothetical protein JWL92_457 [Candidatus Nomurabacteria bacterium]|nr:hypothetical protein [Candidatus Nomurabacteria bacterium]